MNIPQINSLRQHELLCCRVCLMTDCKLYNIHEYKLADTFTRISGTPVFQDRLPQHLCLYCLALLLKCSSFRNMCLRTLDLLTPALLMGTLDTDYVRKNHIPHRLPELTRTENQIIDLNPFEDLYKQVLHRDMLNEQIMPVNITEAIPEVKPEIHDLIEINDTVIHGPDGIVSKDEFTSEIKTEISNVQNLITEKVLNDKKNKTPKKTLTVVKKLKRKQTKTKVIKTDTCIVENIINEKLLNDKKNKTPKKTLKAVKNLKRKHTKTKVKDNLVLKTEQMDRSSDVDKVITKVENVNIDKMDVTDVDVDANNDNNGVEKIQANSKKKGRKKREPQPETYFAQFASSINHSVVTFSKEEQLEVIARRKESDYYKQCPFKCEDCGKGFRVESAYNNHRVKHSPSSGPFLCSICGVRWPKGHRLRTHQRSHQMKFVCNECNFVSRHTGQASKHRASHDGESYKCPHCDKTFIKQTSYFNHRRLAHAANNLDCPDCGETFISKLGLQQHKKLAHAPKPHQFVCAVCSAGFTSAEALSRHSEAGGDHGALSPCEQCGENCASETQLQEHVNEAHSAESHRCERCSMVFNNATALDTHNRRKHLGQRYQGPKRDKICYEPSKRRAMCDQCGATVNAAILEYHKRTHLAVKPHACPHCPKTFALPAALTYHVRSHTGDKPFKCSECSRDFSMKGNLTRHYNVAHLGKRDAFPCPVCGRTSTTRSSVKVHLRAVHGGSGWPRRQRDKRKPHNK
ncbi:zinc finger protein 485-like [Leguminivora glycinivorella]|uniref:zinc finger protein 485-like n=1 Tax=Leguminivora glycinivorella TaxID=1035111 RepID=UPI00200D569D|nr:zinc finger protein 485-like [Leguminivora glycinivorella]